MYNGSGHTDCGMFRLISRPVYVSIIQANHSINKSTANGVSQPVRAASAVYTSRSTTALYPTGIMPIVRGRLLISRLRASSLNCWESRSENDGDRSRYRPSKDGDPIWSWRSPARYSHPLETLPISRSAIYEWVNRPSWGTPLRQPFVNSITATVAAYARASRCLIVHFMSARRRARWL